MRKALLATGILLVLAAVPAWAQSKIPAFGTSASPPPGTQVIDMSNVVAPVNKTSTTFSLRSLLAQAYWPWFSTTPNISPLMPTTSLPKNPYPNPFQPLAPIPAKK